MTLRRKLILTFTILIILVGTAVGLFSYNNAKTMVYDNKKSEMSDTLNRIDINITTSVMQVLQLAENAAENQRVQHILQEESSQEDLEALGYWFDSYISVFQSIANIHILNDQGDILYSYQNWELPVDAEIASVYADAVGKQIDGEIWLSPGDALRDDDMDSKVMPMIKYLHIEDQTVGILVIELNTETFGNLLLSNYGMFASQYTLITDSAGSIISSNKTMEYTWLEEVKVRFDQGERHFEFSDNSKTYYVCGQYNGLTGWETFAVVSLNDFFPQASQLRQAVVSFVAIAILLASMVILLLSYSFTRPIARLKDAMKSMEDGDFTVQVEGEGKDEMGQLVHSFNYMNGQIDHLVNEVYQEKLAQRNAELSALQAQINPHFLYNTLDSINWMLIEKGEFDISDVVVALGDILKYSLRGSQQPVPLREELKYIESYLFIQKNRMEKRLDFTGEVEDQARDIMVPKLILQPVVENAVLHGIEPKKDGGEVSIKASITGEILTLIVHDNGQGMTEEELEACRQRIYSSEEQSGHIGMRNVHRRIRLLFGDTYGLIIESQQNKGTIVTITMPAYGNMVLDENKKGTANEYHDRR